MMPNNFGSLLVNHYLQKSLNKSLFGKITVQYGELIFLSGYLAQCGSILAAAFRDRTHHFLVATVTAGDDSEVALNTLTKEIWPDVEKQFALANGFGEFVTASEMARHKATDPFTFLKANSKFKLEEPKAREMASDYFFSGIALGLCNPNLARKIYDTESGPKNQKEWDDFRAAGLNIPEKQDVIPYDEFEGTMKAMLLAWCEESRPDLLNHLK